MIINIFTHTDTHTDKSVNKW